MLCPRLAALSICPTSCAQSSTLISLSRDRGLYMWTVYVRVFAYTHLCNQRRVAFLSVGVRYSCISPPAVDWCLDPVAVCVCVYVCVAAEVPAVTWCRVCLDARWAASHCVTRLQGDLGLRCQGRRSVCVYVCVLCYFRSFFPSCFPPFALSAVPSFVSERGCDPVLRDGLLGFSLSISWKITAQATFEEVCSHPIDPCLHLSASTSLALLAPPPPVSVCVSAFIL